MGGLSIYLIAACLLLVAQPSLQKPSMNQHYGNENHVGESNFDYLILRQTWPAATCMFPGPNTCAISRNISTWVVHGLWPSIKTEIGPSFCNKTLPFNFNSIKWLLPSLLEFWPNLYTNTALESFWYVLTQFNLVVNNYLKLLVSI